MDENWVKIKSFFLGNLSTITPANKEKKVIGRNCTTPNTPRSKGEFVIESTSQLCPMLCIQVPIKDAH